MKIYQIYCGKFESIFCNDLPAHAKEEIKSLQKMFSYDEYAGYSPEQQKIRKDIKEIVKKHNAIVEISKF
jgi:hypothetical protein